MSATMAGGGRAQVERLLQEAGRDGVVHHHRGSRGRRELGQPGDVAHAKQRVGRRLCPQQRGRGPKLALDPGEIGQVGQDRPGTVRAQPLRECAGVVITVGGEQDLVPVLAERQHQGHRCCLAGGEDEGAGPFDGAQRRFERLPARVAAAPVGAGRIRFSTQHEDAGGDERRRRRLAG